MTAASVSRASTLGVGLLICLSAGTLYAFSAYNKDMKYASKCVHSLNCDRAAMGWNAKDINIVRIALRLLFRDARCSIRLCRWAQSDSTSVLQQASEDFHSRSLQMRCAGSMNDRFGPRLTCVYAAILAGSGYFLMFLQLSTKFSNSQFVMGLFYMLVGQGSIGQLASFAR